MHCCGHAAFALLILQEFLLKYGACPSYSCTSINYCYLYFRKSNCDFDSTITKSPLDDVSSEPEGNRLVSRLKKTHIKKPLNAFMLFMKEMRPRVQEECTLKESAAINQILGKKWHELSRAEQTKYYEMARKAKELHQRLYPGWSARDNYAYHARRRHRRSRRGFPHHRSFISNKTTSSSSTVNTLAKTSPNGRLRSSSFHEERKSIDLPQKILERPHSASDIYSPSLERRMLSSSSPLTPHNPPTQSQSPVITSSLNRVPESQHQPQSQTVAPPPTTMTTSFGSHPVPPPPPPTIQQGFTSPSRPTPLTMSACSAFEQHYNQATSHQVPTSAQLPNPTQQQQYLQMVSAQRGFMGYPPTPASVMYGGVQSHGRGGGGTMSRQMSTGGYWGYQQPQGQMGGQTGIKRSPYLSSDSVAAVAAVAAMAVGELSGGSMKKCRARFGLEHQNLWCKPCRRKKKCIRFISENEVEDYMPHHGHHPLSHHGTSQGHATYNPHSAAVAAMAFNHQTGSQTCGGTSYRAISNSARRQAATAPYSIQKPTGFMPVTAVSGGGNGVPGVQAAQRPSSFSRQTMPQQFPNSPYAQLALGNAGYKRPFPITVSSIPRQQLSDFPVSQISAYRGSTTTDTSSSYWGSNPRSMGSAVVPTFPTNSYPPTANSRFSASEMMLSQGAETKSTHLRETQGSNSSLSYTNTINNHSKIMNNSNFPTQQSTSVSSMNGGGDGIRIKREAPPISFGVADVMGFKTEVSNAPSVVPPPTSAGYRGTTVSPSTSSCPLRSSPELE
ncbi:unnamed protein product [Rodentolepis nana]|uniref:HMG box domain-containing protein n=1 Tax=Rodentolepis nana TaxID=102285 RepID=A0A158QJ36_RODNA|nr:unnamed protein product [Rodentolepis nana]